ncbi:MAG TPA: protein-tyrosine phosphatase family protein [Rhizomicrobium sp.]|jgi:predicted protein tyrosine phosphatase|nr:protein-tyrosine phosphatase family protein [Rhizomicrobium sp.]
MPKILVTPLSAIDDAIAQHRPSHMVTLLSPDHMIEVHPVLGEERHLRLGVQDIVDISAGDTPPAAKHVLTLLEFARDWDAASPMLVHCWAGISRSTAAAFIVACDRLGPGNEVALAQMLRSRAAHAAPNRLMVQIGDDILGRRGKMVDAIEAIGRGAIAVEGKPFELPVSI